MGWLGEPWIRTAAYVIAAAAALLAGLRERRAAPAVGVWPTFWFLSATVLGAMAAGRALDLDGLLTALGREQAEGGGWYANRRGPQAAVIGVISGIWTVSVGLALWLVPERRRRYLPPAVVTFSLMCYSAIRLISLHQVDSLLYRRDLLGLPIGALVDLVLLGLAIALAAGARAPQTVPDARRTQPAATPGRAWWE